MRNYDRMKLPFKRESKIPPLNVGNWARKEIEIKRERGAGGGCSLARDTSGKISSPSPGCNHAFSNAAPLYFFLSLSIENGRGRRGEDGRGLNFVFKVRTSDFSSLVFQSQRRSATNKFLTNRIAVMYEFHGRRSSLQKWLINIQIYIRDVCSKFKFGS